ncbi:MAG: glycoside hydrolase family 44 protein [Terracidiphilus sp.]
MRLLSPLRLLPAAALVLLLHSAALAASAPPVPTGLKATAGAAQVKLVWNAASGATKYHVKRSLQATGTYATIATVTAAAFTDTPATSLIPGVVSYYKVSALNGSVESANSGSVSAKPTFAAPTGLMATAGVTSIALQWKSSSGATQYIVSRSAGSGYKQVKQTSATSFTDSVGLVAGIKYSYEVAAVDSLATSPASAPVAAMLLPAAPAGLKATPGVAQVSLSWKASPGATKYNVSRSAVSGSKYAVVATVGAAAFTDTVSSGLVPGQTFYYVVNGEDSSGAGPNSAQVSATPAFAAPSGLTAAAGINQVTLQWTGSTGATKYLVQRSIVTGSGYKTVATVTTTAFTDKASNGIVGGVTYYYVVAAADTVATSPVSNQASATPLSQGTSVNATVNTLANRHAISPYIYGAAFPPSAAYVASSGLTLTRWGGNNASRYNWKLNAKNIDADWYFEDYSWGTPNSADFITQIAGASGSPLMTIPMLEWVANGTSGWSFSVKKYGAQCSADPWNSDAGDGLKPDCNTPITGNDPTDANLRLLDEPSSGDPAGSIYRNEWLAAIAPNYGTQPHFYNLDNEPDIWGGTHRDIHPEPTGYDELAAAIVKEGHAVKVYDPKAVRLAPVFCCWWFYWNGANGNDKPNHGGLDFLPWLLNEIWYNDQVAGSRSLDVFDVHAYFNGPSTSGLTIAQVRAGALRTTREWWDPTYVSESGTVNQKWTTSIEPDHTVAFVIPRMRALANTIYPGTPASFTEWSGATVMDGSSYSGQGESDFSTGLVDADAYGILGRERMWGASRWTAATQATPAYEALLLYRNPDGAKNGFLPLSVEATSDSDPNLFSVYASMDQAGDAMTLMVLNKDPSNTAAVSFNLEGFTPSTMKSYTLSSAKPTAIVASGAQSWLGTQIFAPYSATLLVLGGKSPTPAAEEWDLNPDTLMANTSSTVTIAPTLLSGTGTVTMTSATGTGGLKLTLTQPKISPATATSSGNGLITITAPSTPGLYQFTVTAKDSGGAVQTQQGWVLATVPAATLTKSGDGQSAPKSSTVKLTATFVPGSSGAGAAGEDLLFTASAGTLSQRIVRTDAGGNAQVTLTLPSTAGKVTVTAVGPAFWGAPAATFTVTAQ